MSVITTTGALVGDTPDLLKPLSDVFRGMQASLGHVQKSALFQLEQRIMMKS